MRGTEREGVAISVQSNITNQSEFRKGEPNNSLHRSECGVTFEKRVAVRNILERSDRNMPCRTHALSDM